ncbi:MAG: M14 family zinc carboxypeptidase [Ferruginibacter sp.]
MNPRKCLLLFFAGVLFFLNSHAQEKYSKVKIPVTSAAIKNFVFANLGLDHYEQDANAIVAVLNTAEMNRLRQSGYSFDLLIDDVVKHTIEVNSNPSSAETNRAAFQSNSCQKVASIIPTPASFGIGGSLRLGAAAGNPGYFTYAEMITKMQNLATAYPSLVSVYTIGNSANGNAIYGVKVSHSDPSENKPEVLYTGLQHAREAIGGTSLIFFMQFLAENFSSDDRVRELLDNRQLYIIPCLNPDGYSFNYGGSSASYPVTGGGLWRKSRRNTGGGAANIGVDLNRNYGIDWGNCSGASSSCGSNVKSDDTYYGTSAFSEPETQALRSFVQSKHFVNAIDQHCFGPYYSLPYGRPSLHPVLSHLDSSYYTYIPALMGLYNGHRAGNSPETVNYEVAGGIKDWLLMGDIGTGTKGKVYGMTGEAGGGDFWAPVSQIIQLCKELCFQNLQLAYAAGDYYDIEDRNDIGISKDSGYFSFQVKRVGLAADPVTVSLVPLSNIYSVGDPISKTLPNYYDTYIDSIKFKLPPTFVCGQKIRFAWKVESGGVTTYDTVTKFYNPLILLNDDMEGSFSTNWTSSPSSGSTAWDFTNLNAVSGTHSMTESPSGNYTTSSTRTVTYKNTFNLFDATAAYLSFWTKHRAENFRDKLQVQVSTDGSTWVAMCGSNTVQEDNTTNGGTLGGQPALTGIRENWTRELFDLSNYIGNPIVYLRFRFTSDNDASSFAFEKDDGFYIDDIKVVKTTSISTVSVKFGDFRAQLLMNNVARLDWEAYTDAQHDYFEVQRATDKNDGFKKIEKIKMQPPYYAFDYTPVTGNNYYRIKEVDNTGKVTYSNVIKVTVQANITATIYPNPVKKELFVNIRNVINRDNYKLLVTDAAGRTIYDQTRSIGTGSNQIKMDVEALPIGIYFLKISDSKNSIVATEKFVKQ